jgi:hypothetical protein
LLHVKKISDAKCWFTTLNESWFVEGMSCEDEPPPEPVLNMLRHWRRPAPRPAGSMRQLAAQSATIKRPVAILVPPAP